MADQFDMVQNYFHWLRLNLREAFTFSQKEMLELSLEPMENYEKKRTKSLGPFLQIIFESVVK